MKTYLPILLLALLYCCKPIETENMHLNAFDFIPFETVNNELDLAIRESSGMAKDAFTYWTHNDSGNPSEIYQISADGIIQNKVSLGDYYNKDWEDMAIDAEHLYIGDFGNNFGNRKDLRILKVRRDSLASTKAVIRDTINFRFPDQTKYYGDYGHNYDCESVIAFGDSLYVFSKNWQDHACRLYRMPKTAGTYDAELVSDFNTQGIITSAALSPDGTKVALVGYNYSGVMDPFIWVFSDFKGTDFFGGKAQRYNLDMKRQTEAIEFADNSTLLITSEKGQAKAAALFKVKL